MIFRAVFTLLLMTASGAGLAAPNGEDGEEVSRRPTCLVCSGEKTVPCGSCGTEGRLEVVCPTCEGLKHVACSREDCLRGRVVCPECKGVGSRKKRIIPVSGTPAFKHGFRKKETILVLEIDSPGGLVSECEKIIDLLGKHRERRSIALVNKRALSAAAILALTCDEIYIDAAGMIGAATAIQQSVVGLSAVDEKFASVWRATCRRAAEIGGHDPLFADAMVDAEVELRLIEEDGRKRLATGAGADGAIVVSPAEKLFTATAAEAVRFGLVKGLASKLEDIEKRDAGLSSWKSVSRRGISIMKAQATGFDRAKKRIEKELKDARKNFDLAVEYDSGRQSYRVGKGNRFTPASRQKWRRYSSKCYGYLGKCESAFKDVVSLTKKYPLHEAQSLVAGEQLKQVAKIRTAIKRRAKRQGI